MTPTWSILEGDCVARLRELDAGSVHTCVTSPPYFGLRDYGTGAWEGGDPGCDHTDTSATKTFGNPAFNENRPSRAATKTVGFRDECGKCGARRVDKQIGLEPSPDEFVAALVGVFREVRRVLRDDGTVWLNLGDSYGTGAGRNDTDDRNLARRSEMFGTGTGTGTGPRSFVAMKNPYKPKDLLGIPWMVAFALRADGWYLRSDIIWSKPSPMPESVTDRPTKAHEYVFLLSKQARYFYDADAIREDAHLDSYRGRRLDSRGEQGYAAAAAVNGSAAHNDHIDGYGVAEGGRNKRSVWTVATQPYAGAHFATFPPKLIEPCILAGCPERACGVCGAPWERVVERRLDDAEAERIRSRPTRAKSKALENGDRNDGEFQGLSGQEFNRLYQVETTGFEPSCDHDDGSASGVVLDPFAGSGTTGMVALRHGRSFVGIELNPAYAALARDRITADAPLLNSFAEVAV